MSVLDDIRTPTPEEVEFHLRRGHALRSEYATGLLRRAGSGLRRVFSEAGHVAAQAPRAVQRTILHHD